MNNPHGPQGSHAALSSKEPSSPTAYEIDETEIVVLAHYSEAVKGDRTLVGLGPFGETATEMGRDDRTLVGLGPPSSGRPVTFDAAKNSGMRPVSEPPGPWGSDAEHEIPLPLRHRNLGVWGVAVPLLLLFAGVTVLAVRGLTPSTKGSGQAVGGVEPAAQAGTGLFVRPSTTDARVFVDGVDHGRPPVLLMDLEPGSHILNISGEGYVPFEQPVTLVPGHVSTLEPVLTRVTDAPPPPALTAEPATTEHAELASATKSAPDDRGAHSQAHAVKPVAIDLEETPAESGATAPASGLLAASSSPPSSVVVDGRPVGKSPRALDLAPGTHSVVFVHPQLGRKSLSVDVTPGKTTSAAVEF